MVEEEFCGGYFDILDSNMCKHVDISNTAAGGRGGGACFEAHWSQVDSMFWAWARSFWRGTREGKYIFVKTSMAVFGLAPADNGGFGQGGIDGGHFDSTCKPYDK